MPEFLLIFHALPTFIVTKFLWEGDSCPYCTDEKSTVLKGYFLQITRVIMRTQSWTQLPASLPPHSSKPQLAQSQTQSGVMPRNTMAALRVNTEAPGFPADPPSAVQTGVFPGREWSVWCVDCDTWQTDCNFQYSPRTLAIISGCLTAYSRLQKGSPGLFLQPDLCLLLCWTIPLDLSQAYFKMWPADKQA